MRATVAAVRWPVAATGAAARGGWPTRAAAVLLLDDDGAVGLGEAAPLPGFGDDDLARARAALDAWLATGAPPASPSARWAIDAATASLDAARRGAAMIGAIGAVAGAAVVADVAEARAALAAGARALKVKLDGAGDRARLAAIRAACPAVELRGDANQTWPLAEVDARLAELADLAVAWIEEPAAGLAPRLTAPRAVPVALDESLAAADRDAWLPAALASGAVAALVMKPTVLGGAAPCRALATAARAAGVRAIVSHALEGPVGLAAARALAAELAPDDVHGTGDHPALTAWGALAASPRGLGLDADAVRAAIGRLEPA